MISAIWFKYRKMQSFYYMLLTIIILLSVGWLIDHIELRNSGPQKQQKLSLSNSTT